MIYEPQALGGKSRVPLVSGGIIILQTAPDRRERHLLAPTVGWAGAATGRSATS